ncbi:LysR substrate-binding domain-containing protein [Trichothermofontia sp.]
MVVARVASRGGCLRKGLGFSILPDYLCHTWISEQRLKLILQPEKAVKNSIWLAYRKTERQSQQVVTLTE